jgi:lipopolysaccharide/colanic/teichoic acid biosynthesis glycosyltransferase
MGIVKRLLDITISLVGLIALSPLFAVISVLIWFLLGSPILFRQQRPGLNGKPFVIYKFRTMSDARDSNGCLLADHQRLGNLGRILRATSIDELPELINVLKGDMSIVGPRPLLMQYLDRYSSSQARRHEVKPGLTGWAQVNGRNSLTWEEKFNLDVWYVDHWSIKIDFKIILMTFGKVFLREGISADGEATSPEFHPHKNH